MGRSLLVDLVKTRKVIKLTAAVLQQLLSSFGVASRKNATKSFKIKLLLKIPEVEQSCSKQELDDLIKFLDNMDKKRAQKNHKNDDAEEEEIEPDSPNPMCIFEPVWV